MWSESGNQRNSNCAPGSRSWNPRLASAEAALAQWSKIIPSPGFFLIRPAPISRNIRRRRCEPKALLLHLAASTLWLTYELLSFGFGGSLEKELVLNFLLAHTGLALKFQAV
jgi:hypothetical protein